MGDGAVELGSYADKPIAARRDSNGGILLQRERNGGAASVIDMLADEVHAAGSGPHAGGLGRIREGRGEEGARSGSELLIGTGLNPVKHPRSP